MVTGWASPAVVVNPLCTSDTVSSLLFYLQIPYKVSLLYKMLRYPRYTYFKLVC